MCVRACACVCVCVCVCYVGNGAVCKYKTFKGRGVTVQAFWIMFSSFLCGRLTVTDADGLSGVAYATVTVNPEPYYPPQASAGKDQLLLLPQNQVTLDGSNSIAYKVVSVCVRAHVHFECVCLLFVVCRGSCSIAGRC